MAAITPPPAPEPTITASASMTVSPSGTSGWIGLAAPVFGAAIGPGYPNVAQAGFLPVAGSTFP